MYEITTYKFISTCTRWTLWLILTNSLGLNLFANDYLKDLQITNVNSTQFPEITTTLIVKDSSDIPVRGLGISNFNLDEDSTRETITITPIFKEGAMADITFVIDTTSSMGPYIDKVKNRINGFVDSLSARSIDYSLGLVTFGDSYDVNNSGQLTKNVEKFKAWIDGILPAGGGSRPENPYGALGAAIQMSYRPGAQKICILITDAAAHYKGDPDSSDGHWAWSLPEIVDELNQNKITCHVIGPRLPEYSGSSSLAAGTGGKFFYINDDFSKILDEITTLITGQYLLTHTSHNMWADGSARQIDIHVYREQESLYDSSHYIAPDKTTPISLHSDSQEYYSGQMIDLEIQVGSSEYPARGIYGLSLIINYDTTLVYLDNKAGDFFGADTLSRVWAEPDSHRINISVTKLGGACRYGHGLYRLLQFNVQDNLVDSTTTTIRLNSIVAYDSLWVRIPIITDSISLKLLPVAEQLTVWPGDTDNNGIVNQTDILPVGVFWQESGPTRPNGSIKWVGQPCPSWTPDDRLTYIDASGDGVIDANEINVIGLNWGKKQNAMNVRKSLTSTAQGIVSAEIKEGVQLGRFVMHVDLHDMNEIVGVSFELYYSANHIANIVVKQGDVFNSDALFFCINDTAKSVIGVAVSFKGAEQTVGKNDNIVKIEFQADPYGERPLKHPFDFINMTAITKDGTLVPLELLTLPENDAIQVPEHFQLEQNFPNPFNPATKFRYHVPQPTLVQICIFDITGRLVNMLVDEVQEAGIYDVVWHGLASNGRAVSGGVYFYRLETESFSDVKKCVLIR